MFFLIKTTLIIIFYLVCNIKLLYLYINKLKTKKNGNCKFKIRIRDY